MDTEYYARRFDSAAKGLCNGLFASISALPDTIKAQAQEIRIRVNRPVAIYCTNKMYYLTEDGRPVTTFVNGKIRNVTQQEVLETFQNLCGYSVYSHQKEIQNGFLTIRGGHRAGICGTAVYKDRALTNIRDVSSVNIRIARQVDGAADPLLEALGTDFKGLLLCGAPACGKTTVLRDLARQLTDTGQKKVCVIDERGELAGTYAGVCQNDLGQSDILNGYTKGEGIMQALRCLSPDIIICDEAGSSEDVQAIAQGVNAGVSIVASIHAATPQELLARSQGRMLLKTGAFESVVFFKGRQKPGEMKEIKKTKELFYATLGGRNGNYTFRRTDRPLCVAAAYSKGLFF